MHPILMLINLILNTFRWALIIWIIISWLIQFGILNRHQPLVYRINDALSKLFEPILAKIRKHIPPLGSIDISPIVLLIGIVFLQYTLNYYLG